MARWNICQRPLSASILLKVACLTSRSFFGLQTDKKLMQTIRHLMAVGVSVAIALGGTLGNSQPGNAQANSSSADAPANSAQSSQAEAQEASQSASDAAKPTQASSSTSDRSSAQLSDPANSSNARVKPTKAKAQAGEAPSASTSAAQFSTGSTSGVANDPNTDGAVPATNTANNTDPPAAETTTSDTIRLPSLSDLDRPEAGAPELADPRAIPDYLNPSPNPLNFPTNPADVRIVGTQPITLEQAITLAQRNSQTLQTARLNLERSQATLRQAQAALYPDVDTQLQVSRSNSNRDELTPTTGNPFEENTGQASTSVSGSAGLTYDVYTSGLRAANIRAARQQIRFNELELENQIEQIRLDVSNDYYDLQDADEQVRIAQAAVNNAQASLRDAQALERAGVGTRFDVLRSQVQLANAQQDLTQAIANRRVARRQLSQRLNIPPSIDLAAADPVQIAGLWSLPLEDSILLALRNRAELEQQLVQRDINEQQRRAALASIRPQIQAFINFNFQEQLDDDLGTLTSNSIGARLNWNVFDGGEARARARQEEIDIELAETQFSDLSNQVRFAVEQAYYNLLANFENIQTASVALEQARESLRLARLRFQAGVGTQTDVINAETELTRAESNRLAAILNYNRSLAALQRSISNIAGEAAPDTTPATP